MVLVVLFQENKSNTVKCEKKKKNLLFLLLTTFIPVQCVAAPTGLQRHNEAFSLEVFES